MTTPLALEDLSWHSDALDMLAAWAASGLSFTAEDLRRSMRPAPFPNDWGNVFQCARRAGLITTVGFKESEQPSRKGGVIRVWVAADRSKS